ncbi:hypothetical protein RND71_036206 [Anisodus tanguticus]|uniref:Uncharacterized protein n=1 Tax=Anisodus tanguticus TaxID=243964 RepID=A0AAE1V2X4_9SOLA|nr:hypothetical protein RND71_036206 [Anisodus tanguticus]
MAHVSIITGLVVTVVVVVVAATAQELSPALAPDAGAAFSLPVSDVLMGTSLLVSLFALFRQ